MKKFKMKLKDPVVLRDIAREYGIDWQWLRRQSRATPPRIRSQKVGRYLMLEREDVEALVSERKAAERITRRRQGK